MKDLRFHQYKLESLINLIDKQLTPDNVIAAALSGQLLSLGEPNK